MRVRLSYSVELDEVPDSVAELIEGELFRIDKAKENIGKALEGLCQEEPHLDLVAKSLDNARQTLAAIDVRLNECESILGGYERAMNPPAQPQQPMMAPPVPQVAAPAQAERPEANSERKVHTYRAPYSVPDTDVISEEPAEDQQFDGVDYTSPYEIPRESDK